jgi:hypothetical protein
MGGYYGSNGWYGNGCPSCGYCPHCGRGGRQTMPVYPQWPQQPPPDKATQFDSEQMEKLRKMFGGQQ